MAPCASGCSAGSCRRCGSVEHWIVDDTTLLKSGRHSVGVAIQYSGLVGTTANCQSLVSLSLATGAASMPVACELYLPEEWAHVLRDNQNTSSSDNLAYIRWWSSVRRAIWCQARSRQRRGPKGPGFTPA